MIMIWLFFYRSLPLTLLSKETSGSRIIEQWCQERRPKGRWGKLPKPKWKSRRKIPRPWRRHINSVDRKDPIPRWRCRAAINDTSPHYCMVISLWSMFGHSDNAWSGWPSSPFFVFARREIWSSSWKDEMYKEVDRNFSSSHLTETEWDVRL